MAITKAHIELQAKKTKARSRIYELNAEIRQALNRVPASVINGSRQAAVEWKAAALSIPAYLSQGGRSATLGQLTALVVSKKATLRILRGEKS